jgi:gas vesicle protein
MNHSGFMKGMATGLVVGAAVTMITDPLTDRQRHQIAKKTEGVFKSVGSVIDTAMDIMK